MRWLISFLILVVMAVGLAIAGRYDPGYVVLVYPPWRIEISFIAFILLLVGVVFYSPRQTADPVRLPHLKLT